MPQHPNLRRLALLILTACANPAEPFPRSVDQSPPPAPPPADPRQDWEGTIALATCNTRDDQDMFCTSSGFTLMRPGVTDQVILTTPYIVGDPAWSPDGKWLAFTAYAHCAPVPRECPQEIYRMTRFGQSVMQVGPAGLYSYSPAWSPDGSRIVFASADEIEGPYHLMIMNADGSGLRTLGGLSGGAPAWSPDGRRIAYSGTDADGYFAIFMANSDGTVPTQVTFPAEDGTGWAWDGSPAWSPDGEAVAFTHGVQYADGHGSCQMHSMKPDGSGLVVLTNDSFCASKPVWFPGGRLIAYQGIMPESGGLQGLILMNADGTQPFLLRQMGYDFSRVAWTSK